VSILAELMKRVTVTDEDDEEYGFPREGHVV
jgi:hypothetical protein